MTRQPPKRIGTKPASPPAEAEAGPSTVHVPVLVDAVVAALAPRDDAVYVDATFGGGGYSRALLSAARCRVVAIDCDPEAVARGHDLEKGYAGRLLLIEGRFGDMVRLLGPVATGPIAGIALDLGLSSIQLDTPARGFSFRGDGPLDMRMSGAGQDAAELVATLSEGELFELIDAFGEERFARRVARAIVSARRRAPIRRTHELAAIVRGAVLRAETGLDPATRTFQALRIAVNDELGELDRGLAAAEQLLMPGGRLAVVSFHSLEDRRVKDFLRARSAGAPRLSRHEPAPVALPPPSFRLLHRRAVAPGAAEIARNPRARSARLRAAERTAAAAWAANHRQPGISRLGGQVA
jgi:16S rRNA (cytosine1402-N4)-methyltransferase